MARQQLDIGSTLPERRNRDRDNVQSKVEIRPEELLRNRLLKIAIGRGNDPDVGLDRLYSPNPLKFTLLEDAKQLHLELRWHITNLVEKERPAIGNLELSLLLVQRGRKRALLVPEELTFEQPVDQAGRVDGDQWFIGTRTSGVNGLCDQLLPRSGLTIEHDG